MSTTFETKYAGNSLSTGTVRPVDLIPPFMDALRELDAIGASNLAEDERVIMNALDGTYSGDREYSAADVALILDGVGDFLETLTDSLDLCATEGYRFGAHEGDGADFGFWPI